MSARTIPVDTSNCRFRRSLAGVLLIGCLVLDLQAVRISRDIAISTRDVAVGAPMTNDVPLTKRGDIDEAPFVLDSVCGGCRTTRVIREGRHVLCGKLVRETITRTPTMTFEQAGQHVVQQHPKCQVCLASSCHDEKTRYWRYDRVFPQILQATSHYLPSVPHEYRLPQELLDAAKSQGADDMDDTYKQFFRDPQNSYPKRRYLFEYNPSLIRIPKEMLPNLTTPNGETPAYLASYRLSTYDNCFHPNTSKQMLGGIWKDALQHVEHLGLALLRADLSIIQDVALRPSRKFFGKFEDYRLFLLKGQIYIATFCHMAPLWIHSTTNNTKPVLARDQYIVPRLHPREKGNTDPNSFQVSMGQQVTLCSGHDQDKKHAKSVHYFLNSKDELVVETRPLDPHVVQKARLAGEPNPKDTVRSHASPKPSHFNRAEVDFAARFQFWGYPFTEDRGSACCVHFEDPRFKTGNLLLGISHAKTEPKWNGRGIVADHHYVSRFYSFEPTPPYRTVAVSGQFCLPANPKNQAAHYSVAHPSWKVLQVANTTYQCPQISFVSGMTVKADDPSRLIISYGANDCTSWFVEVSLPEVLDLLLYGPSTNASGTVTEET